MKRVLVFDEHGLYIEDKIEGDNYVAMENEYTAELDEVVSLYLPKLVNGKVVEGKTIDEIEESKLLDSLMPSKEDIESSEFEIRALTLLMELGLI